jgi:hypothetical protein
VSLEKEENQNICAVSCFVAFLLYLSRDCATHSSCCSPLRPLQARTLSKSGPLQTHQHEHPLPPPIRVHPIQTTLMKRTRLLALSNTHEPALAQNLVGWR